MGVNQSFIGNASWKKIKSSNIDNRNFNIWIEEDTGWFFTKDKDRINWLWEVSINRWSNNSVTLKSWKSYQLSEKELALREKNMRNQWLDPNSSTAQQTGGAVSGSNTSTSSSNSNWNTWNQGWTWASQDWTWGVIDTQENVDKELIDAQRDAYNYNQSVEDKLNQGNEDYINNLNQIEEERLRNAEDYYNKADELIKKQNADIQAIEQDQVRDYEKRIARDSALLEEKKASETAYLKAQQEKQRTDNAEAIRQAKVQVEIERQQSAWGYNKIGLGFSSGIINQSQQIATEGIVKIAEIKATMTMQEAQMTAKIADVEFNYANLVNKTIDTYTDKIDSVKKDMKTRINETNQNLLKNSYQRKTEIDDIKQWAIEEKRKSERQHIEDIQNVKQQGIEYLKDIQQSVANYQQRELWKLDTMLQNGTIMNLSPQQIAQKEASLWLPAWTINAQIDTWITQDIRARFDWILWADYPIQNLGTLIDDVKSEMKAWRSYAQAVENVMARELKTNQDYIDMKNTPSLDEKKYQLDIAKYELDKAYKAGLMDINQYEAETARLNAETNAYKAETWRIDVMGSEPVYSGLGDAWTDPSWNNLVRTVEPSGNITTMDFSSLQGKDVVVDKVAGKSLEWVLDSDLFSWVVVWSAYRTEEEQAKLYEELSATWATVARPWESAHQSGMALDLYDQDENWNLIALSEDKVKALNEAGWYQNAWDADLWHFEFVWTQNIKEQRQAIIDEYQAIFNKSVPKDMTVEAMRQAIMKNKEEEFTKTDAYSEFEKARNEFDLDDDWKFKDYFKKAKEAWLDKDDIIKDSWAIKIKSFKDPEMAKYPTKTLFYNEETSEFWVDEWFGFPNRYKF